MLWITVLWYVCKVHYQLSLRCYPQYRWHNISSGFCFLIWKLSNLMKSISMNNARRGVGRSESIRRAWEYKRWTVPSYHWVRVQAVHKGLGCFYIKREVALHKTWYKNQIFWLKFDYNRKVSHLPSPGTGRWNRSVRLQLLRQFPLSFQVGRSKPVAQRPSSQHLHAPGRRSNQLSNPLLLVLVCSV